MQQFPLSSVISREFLQKELDFCREKLGAMLPRFQDCFHHRVEACFLKAAQTLRRRYFPQAGIIQACGTEVLR